MPCRPWTPREDALLGKLTDREVSRRLGRGMGGVRRRRWILGINVQAWHTTGARSGIVRKWTAAEQQLAGTMPDAELARQLGRRYQSVARMRKSLGRPNVRPPHPLGWKAWEEQLVGVLPDREVARRTGRSRDAVRARRRSKGLARAQAGIQALDGEGEQSAGHNAGRRAGRTAGAHGRRGRGSAAAACAFRFPGLFSPFGTGRRRRRSCWALTRTTRWPAS